MAAVVIDSGELPSAEGVPEGHELAQVVGRWQSIAHGRFRDDCRFLLQMIDETDRLRLWEKNVGGFTFATRDEFLQRKVLIDYDLTETQTRQIVEALKAGHRGGIGELVDRARSQVDPESTEYVTQGKRTDLEEHRVNNTKLNDRNQHSGILRRLARERPDLLDRIEHSRRVN